MNRRLFSALTGVVALTFMILFSVIVIPPFMENPDLFGAFAAGFVNPYASGYSIDVFCCWFILLIWVIYESPKVKYGWVCLLIGLIPGVAVGFGAYLLLRSRFREIEN